MTDEPSTHEAMRLATFGPRFEGNSLLVDDDKTILWGLIPASCKCSNKTEI